MAGCYRLSSPPGYRIFCSFFSVYTFCRTLSKLHLQVSEHVSVNRSELVGVAIDVLALLLESKEGLRALESAQIQDSEELRQITCGFVKS